jgi:LacI family transcriptional regulator
MAVTDLHARWIMEAAVEPGQLIPAKFAVLGVDDDILQNSLCPIGLSSVRLAGLRVGFDAAELAMRLTRTGQRTVSVQTVPPVDVVVRQSTGALAIRDPLVARALRLMRDRMGQLADAAAVVEAMGVSRRTLEVHFRAATGRTLAGELARMRVARARELLSDTNLSIKEIAYLVGFSEPRMLSKVFRRLSGELPSVYRNRVQPAYGLAAGDVQ